jgi:hypothetical protein
MGQEWYHTLLISATQKAEMGGSQYEVRHGEKHETLSGKRKQKGLET